MSGRPHFQLSHPHTPCDTSHCPLASPPFSSSSSTRHIALFFFPGRTALTRSPLQSFEAWGLRVSHDDRSCAFGDLSWKSRTKKKASASRGERESTGLVGPITAALVPMSLVRFQLALESFRLAKLSLCLTPWVSSTLLSGAPLQVPHSWRLRVAEGAMNSDSWTGCLLCRDSAIMKRRWYTLPLRRRFFSRSSV